MSKFIVIPSITNWQPEFARRMVAVDNRKTARRTSLVELDAFFAILQHRAFIKELFK